MQKYSCEVCNYKCNYESHWKQHIDSNKHKNNGVQTRSDKVLENKCKFCHFESNNLTNMTTHILTKHSVPEKRKEQFKYYCEKCDFGTFTEILFKRHNETKKHLL